MRKTKLQARKKYLLDAEIEKRWNKCAMRSLQMHFFHIFKARDEHETVLTKKKLTHYSELSF